MTDMVEKVGKAIWDSRTRGSDSHRYNYEWEHVTAEIRKSNMEHARAAIHALMEPTEEMWAAGCQQRWFGGDQDKPASTERIWQAMLKTALDD